MNTNHPRSTDSTNILGRLSRAVALAIIGFAAVPVLAQPAAPESASWQKPAWLTDLSVSVKESYDDNVFLSGKPYLLPYVVPAGSVAALKGESSWGTTLSPKIGFDFAPLLGDRKALQTLSLAYAPDYAIYAEQSSETYQAHRFLGTVKGGTGALSFSLDDTFAYVHGSDYGPFYPGNYISAYDIAYPRERREQVQDMGLVGFQYSWDKWFVRPTASLTYYDLMTKQINAAGYQNYEDRYDVNGGADVGYKITPDVAMTLGYRYGHQYQEHISFWGNCSSSDYQRVLLGLEGKPWKWLDVKIQGGPDFRNYEAGAPVNDPHRTTYYGEASLTATISSKDTVSFKYKGWQWVSSSSRVPYFDSNYNLTYHRKLTDKLGLDLGTRLMTADYTMGSIATCQRDDWQYTFSAGLGYDFNPHASLNLNYAVDLGRADLAGPGVTDNQYDRQFISLALKYAF